MCEELAELCHAHEALVAAFSGVGGGAGGRGVSSRVCSSSFLQPQLVILSKFSAFSW